jgi:hypothetical protein
VLGRRRGPRWARVGHGLYLPSDACGPHDELLAWSAVLPAAGAFTHLTSARERGWWLPPLPDDLPVFVAMAEHGSRPQRSGLRVLRSGSGPTVEWYDGVPLASPAETLLASARDLGLLDMVVMCDSAVHLGSCTLEDLQTVSRPRRRGAPMLRRALTYVDSRTESAWESMLRMLHVSCGVPVEPQYVLTDDAGLFVARADLRIVGTRTLHEYDGGDHLQRPRQRKDLARLRRIGDVAWTRRGYSSVEVLHQAVGILRDADRSLGRPHDPRRIRAWHRLLAGSLFTAAGTEKLRRRWGLPPSQPQLVEMGGC